MEELAAVVDTSVLVDFFRGDERAVSGVMRLLSEGTPYTTAVTLFEFFVGVDPASRRGQNARKLFDRLSVLPLDSNAALLAASIARDLSRAGRPIGTGDVLIAGIALANRLPVMTSNVDHFRRVGRLKVLSPGDLAL